MILLQVIILKKLISGNPSSTETHRTRQIKLFFIRKDRIVLNACKIEISPEETELLYNCQLFYNFLNIKTLYTAKIYTEKYTVAICLII